MPDPKIAILADPLSADVFTLTDFRVRTAPAPDAAPALLEEILNQECEIVFITEPVAATIQDQIREAQEKTEAIITVIPGVGASRHLGKEMLLTMRRSVIGQ